ncbi:N-acetylmuramoyl-L-alanine amidase [Brenneria rubrifaciens]|uniref:N-acetylmuramoyl-L-alanine amidase n=1 Tax=Brenneria rubrifaciens TaxID=55213 RepID=A0A4P8QTY2_9GAMM|nr:N-acetylmuramoyl-L-alanine amidase [Brenneria rubrifaciens]QCR08890.1 N-acetylmuramoyl-L-alanine amidase [Brenneria rubrifaciens]
MIRYMAMLMLLVLAGCQSVPPPLDQSEYQLVTTQASRAQEPRIRFLVIHYTAENLPTSLDILTNHQVSSHYLIPASPHLEKGKPVAWHLVPESQAAWHAGAGGWRGFTHLNNASIGIELENPGYRQTLIGPHWTPFASAQIALLTAIARSIVARYQIAPQNVVAHSDIAPLRKQDPGPLFPWKALAQAGIGAWPDEARVSFYLNGRPFTQPVDSGRLVDKLARYGYMLSADMTERQKRQVIAAFQLHFRPENHQGYADAQTEAIVDALLERYGAGQ